MEYFHWLEKWKAKMWRALLLYPAIALLTRLNEIGAPWAIVTSGTVPIAHGVNKRQGYQSLNIG